MTKNKRRLVFDKQGNEYELIRKIGQGGQGVVLTTNYEGMLVKVLDSKDPLKQEKWLKQVNWSLSQNLSDLHLALPKAQIVKPRMGYVMELMDGLIPLQEILEESYLGLVEEQSIAKYISSGGLKRRLVLLLKIARILAELHSRGYAYGDISPANIFISKDPIYSEVWLIDCDNLCFNEKQGATHVFTPGYGAPEVVKSNCNVNCLTDAWSFATMAFELLTHQHPFKGLFVEDGDPEVVEQQAFEGALPWVYDSEDQSNESVGGLDLTLVANSKMIELFNKCFTLGKTNPNLRPTINQWRDVLQEAADHLINCKHCESNYFYLKNIDDQCCPFCDGTTGKSDYVVFEQILVDENEPSSAVETFPLGYYRILNEADSINFNSKPYNTELWFNSEESVSISLEEGSLFISPNSEASFELTRNGKSLIANTTKRVKQSLRNENYPYQMTTWLAEESQDSYLLELVKSYRWQFV